MNKPLVCECDKLKLELSKLLKENKTLKQDIRYIKEDYIKIQEIEKQKNIEIELLNNKIAHLNNTKNKKQINSSIIEDNNNFEITNNKKITSLENKLVEKMKSLNINNQVPLVYSNKCTYIFVKGAKKGEYCKKENCRIKNHIKKNYL